MPYPSPFADIQNRPDAQYRGQGFFLAPDETPVVLTANQVKPVTIKVSFDYALTAIVGKSTGAYSLQIKDETGYTFSNNPIHSDLLVGTASHPHYLNPFFNFHGGQTLVLSFTDLSGAGNDVYLAFEAVRLIPK